MKNIAIRNIVLYFDIIALRSFSYIPRCYISGNLLISLDLLCLITNVEQEIHNEDCSTNFRRLFILLKYMKTV